MIFALVAYVDYIVAMELMKTVPTKPASGMKRN